MHDLIIIGGGPCGLSTAIAAKRAGLDAFVLEKAALTNTIVGYPLQTRFFSTADNLAIGDIPWPAINPHPSRIEALTYYRTVADHFDLPVRCYEPAVAIERVDDAFVVRTERRDTSAGTYQSRAVVFAYGSYDTPNRLGVPGEEVAKVAHYYTEGHPFYRQHVAVVGGGNSAAEAALDLFNHGAYVTLIHQFAELDQRVKPWVQADLLAWIKAGRIATRWNTQIRAIEPHSVTIQTPEGEEQLPNDWVFALIGYRPNVRLLEQVGVVLDADAVPQHNPETYETNVSNVFVAGVLTAGALPSRVFIENGRYHGPRIVEVLRERRG